MRFVLLRESRVSQRNTKESIGIPGICWYIYIAGPKVAKRILQHRPRAAPGRPAPMFQHAFFHFPRLSPWPDRDQQRIYQRIPGIPMDSYVPVGYSRFPEQSTGKWKNAFFSIAPELPLAGPPLCSSMRFSTFPELGVSGESWGHGESRGKWKSICWNIWAGLPGAARGPC